MKCPECRKGTLTSRRENHRYEESGLPNVVLVDTEVRHCAECGAQLVAIPRLSQLHRSIALSLINKVERLTPAEVRYLRKSLGWSGVDFAAKMHVDASTVSRWENETDRTMEIGYELALRLAVAIGEKFDEYEVQRLDVVASGNAAHAKLRFRAERGVWLAEPAAA